MATRRNYRDEDDYDYPRRAPSTAPAWAMAIAMIGAAIAFGLWLYPDIAHTPGLPEQGKGAQGGQAPKDVRGSYGGTGSFVQNSAPSTQAGIDAYNAAEQAKYDAAIKAGGNPVLVQSVAPAEPLPLNSAGEPVISEAQQQQMNLSLQLAEQEANAAADAALQAQRDAANADAAARAPDVTYQEAVDLLHRDPCHVPRANPATCAQGLYKPTPVN